MGNYYSRRLANLAVDFASIIALAIIVERFWALRSEIVAPSNLLPEVKNGWDKAL